MTAATGDVPDHIRERQLITARDRAGREAFQDVTRIVVVNADGYTEYWADAWMISVQDGGKTVKLIACGSGAQVIRSRTTALAESLGVSPVTAAEFAQAVAETEGQPDRYR
ncbi:hypothetical protein PP613_23380 [Mycobacteroides abscessus]|nr:hypothetical protein [Mycobacteroides abscessus]MDM2412285.1 hypothetical protein [Mycobacteroides abscessus]